MCIGESQSDTLLFVEQSYLREAAKRRLPTYSVHVRTNDDDIVWVVLEPADDGPAMPRFTICRIDPCIMVMTEDYAMERRFSSMSNVEDAVIFACRAAEQAVVALCNVHAAPQLAQ